MDLTAIGSAVSSLKATTDIAKGLLSLHTMAEVQSVAVELNGKILDAYQQIFTAKEAQTALIERVRELEGEITRMKDWEAEKKRYKMVSPAAGAVVFALQRAMSNGEPPHYLCANCFRQGRSSILNDVPDKTSWHHWTCMACKSQAPTGYRGPDQMRYAEDLPAQP